MDHFERQIDQMLLRNFRQTFRHACEHLYSETRTEVDELQGTINLQVAFELLTKLYLVRSRRARSILTKKYQTLPERELLEALAVGSLATQGFEYLKSCLSEIGLSGWDLELLTKFQHTRNALIHLGLPSVPADAIHDSVLLVIRIVNQIILTTRGSQDLQILVPAIKELVGEEVFRNLVSNSAYQNEAIDLAATHDSRALWCIACETWASAEMPDGDFVCFVCGYRAPAAMLSYADCVVCHGVNALAFDAVAGHDHDASSKCVKCGFKGNVFECGYCGAVVLSDKECSCFD